MARLNEKNGNNEEKWRNAIISGNKKKRDETRNLIRAFIY